MSLRSVSLRPAGTRARRTATAVEAAGAGLLARAGRELMALLEADEIAPALAALVVPGLADACAVDVVDAGGQVRRVYATAADGTTDVLPSEIPDGEAAAGACRLVLALVVDDEAGGTLTLARAGGWPFGDGDRALAEALARMAALALRNAGATPAPGTPPGCATRCWAWSRTTCATR